MKTKDKENVGGASEADVNFRTDGFYYRILPFILALLALVCSLLRFILVKMEVNSEAVFRHEISLTSLFDGNPNLIAILGCLCMFLCIAFIPKLMLKKRKSGDGLGLMFMPLGLLGVFTVLSTIENKKDISIGILFGVVLFIISAIGTFKKAVKFVWPLCLIMIAVATFLILAGYMPYCYNQIPYVDEQSGTIMLGSYFYLNYYVRDILLLLSYGIFADRLTKIYQNQEVEKK